MNFLYFPFFLINYKCYYEIIGEKGINFSRIVKKVIDEVGFEIYVSPIVTEIREVSKMGLKVFAQSADSINPGSYTGHIPLEAIKEAGAIGVIINHSEKKLDRQSIKFLIDKCKELKIFSLVCGSSPEECYELSKFKPDIIAIEPPELIGTGKSVSKYKPESIIKTINLIKSYDDKIKVICGAGITNEEDVIEALKLGSEGILISSSIIKSKNPYNLIKNICLSIKDYVI